jgi:hypothetical protein
VTAAVQQSFNAMPSALNPNRSETKAEDRANPRIRSTILYVPLPVFDADIATAAETAAKTIAKKLKHSEFLADRTRILKDLATLR